INKFRRIPWGGVNSCRKSLAAAAPTIPRSSCNQGEVSLGPSFHAILLTMHVADLKRLAVLYGFDNVDHRGSQPADCRRAIGHREPGCNHFAADLDRKIIAKRDLLACIRLPRPDDGTEIRKIFRGFGYVRDDADVLIRASKTRDDRGKLIIWID